MTLRLSDVSRHYGDVRAVDGVSLEVRSGEMFGLLGPSGCGKTTTLRMIAGLESPHAGQIVVAGQLVADAGTRTMVPPERRNMAMVFQSYAIWPHMTVAQNVAFPLRLRRVSRKEIDRRVTEVLELTGLGPVASRPATRLSGGQQQRVALARAVVYQPTVLLLDEPLSNLDAKLREQMRVEIRRLQRELHITVVFVTHDQAEAMSLGDRLAVMNAGRIEQVGSPAELYEHPNSVFVRDFLGRVVMFHGRLTRGEDGFQVVLDGDSGTVDLRGTSPPPEARAADHVTVVCRPDDVMLRALDHPVDPALTSVRGQVETAMYLGDHIEYLVRVGDRASFVVGPRRSPHVASDPVLLEFDQRAASVWPG